MSWPIYIPSKGRPESKLFSMIPEAIIVVEPQDLLSYQEQNPNHQIAVLPENDQGIAYVRNYIKDHAACDWYWMMDDDITDFFVTGPEGQKKIAPSEALILAQETIRPYQSFVGQVAFEYSQFSWSAKTSVKFNSYCDVCVAINQQLTKTCRYRGEFNLKEDRDFTLQVLSSGSQTLRLSQLGFRAPKNGSNKGGLFDVYAAQQERVAVDRMVQQWGPQICTAQTKTNGRYDLKINWRFFKT